MSLAPHLEGAGVELGSSRLGDQHLAAGGSGCHPRGDVDVDPVIITTELSRPAHVQAGAESGAVTGDLDLGDLAGRVNRRLEVEAFV